MSWLAGLMLILVLAPKSTAGGEIEDLAVVLAGYRQAVHPQGRMSVSADGTVIAFTGTQSTAGASSKVYMARLRGDKNPEEISNGYAPSVAPDGFNIAFFSEASGNTQVWLYDIRKTALHRLTSISGGVRVPAAGFETTDWSALTQIAWSPDSGRIAFAHATPDSGFSMVSQDPWLFPGDAEARVSVFPADDPRWPIVDAFPSGFSDHSRLTKGGESEHSSIFVADVRSGRVHRIPSRSTNLIAPLWLPEGQDHIIASARQYGRNHWMFSRSAAPVELDVSSGREHNLAGDQADDTVDEFATVSFDGRFVASLRHRTPFESAGDFPRSLMVFDRRRQTERQVDVPLTPMMIAWRTRNSLWIVGRDQLESVLVSLSLNSGKVNEVKRRRSSIVTLAASKTGQVTFIEHDRETPLRLATLDGEGVRSVVQFQSPLHGFRRGVMSQPLIWRSADGRVISGLLLLPERPTEARFPVILNTYPESANWGYGGNPTDGDEIFLRTGFAVLHTNSRSPFAPDWGDPTTGQSASAIERRDALIADLDGALLAAVATSKVDPDRICAFGHSHGGGSLVQYLLAPRTLKCAVFLAPSHSAIVQDSLFAPSQIAPLFQNRFLWEDAETYHQLDGPGRANAATTPILLAVGSSDTTFSIDTSALFNALRFADKNVSLLLYAGAGHNLEGRAEVDFWQRKLAFVRQYLN